MTGVFARAGQVQELAGLAGRPAQGASGLELGSWGAGELVAGGTQARAASRNLVMLQALRLGAGVGLASGSRSMSFERTTCGRDWGTSGETSGETSTDKVHRPRGPRRTVCFVVCRRTNAYSKFGCVPGEFVHTLEICGLLHSIFTFLLMG